MADSERRYGEPSKGKRMLPYQVRRRQALASGEPGAAERVVLCHTWEALRFPLHRGSKRCRACGGRGFISDPVVVEWPSGNVTLEKASVCVTCDGCGTVRKRRANKV